MKQRSSIISTITPRGYVVVKDSISSDVLDAIRQELTVKPNVNPDFAGATYVEPYPVYQESAKKVYLPRFYGIKTLGIPTQGTKFPAMSPLPNLETHMVLRDYQLPIVTETLKILRGAGGKGDCEGGGGGCGGGVGGGGGVLELYTGSGKTSIAVYIMCELKVKTLIVVHKSFLLQQWVDRIKQFAPKARIGTVQGTRFDVDNKDVVIGMLQTLSMREFSESEQASLSEFGFVCVDETHHIGAEVFCRALPKVASRYMIGLSATPIRKDGLTKVIHWFIGDTAYQLQRNGADAQKVYVKKIMFKSNDASYKRECRNFKGTIMLPQMISNVVEYAPRNAVIVHEVMQYAREQGRQVMVISDRIQHLHNLRDTITAIIDSDASAKLTVGMYTGQQKQKELQISEKANIILSSYAMCREGLDIQSLNTLILSTSTGDVVQTCGRILRKVHDVSPLIVDVVDCFSTFVGQSKKRDAFYKKSQYAVLSYVYNAGAPLHTLDKTSSQMLAEYANVKSQGTSSTRHLCEDSSSDETETSSSDGKILFLSDDE